MLRLSMAIFTLSIIDAYFTLYHISRVNGREINPLMNWFLQNWGVIGFVSAKIILTLVGLGILIYVSDFVSWAKQSLQIILFIYVVLTMYHVFLAVRFW